MKIVKKPWHEVLTYHVFELKLTRDRIDVDIAVINSQILNIAEGNKLDMETMEWVQRNTHTAITKLRNIYDSIHKRCYNERKYTIHQS
jgi:hypothetical protein